MSWEHFGYESNKPCRICGVVANTKEEPRFGYSICKIHHIIPPAFLTDAAKEFKLTGKTSYDFVENEQCLSMK